jgi:tripartite ATP-independent transporter DctP family solute receptor
LAIVPAVLLALTVFAGCAGGNDDAASTETSSGDAAYVIRIASDETDDTPCSEATFIFKELVETNSDGKVTVEYFYDSAMGDEREIAESVQMGNLEMGIISGTLLATYDGNWYINDLPYIYEDRDTMYELLSGDVGDYLRESLLGKSNIQVLDYADGSFKVILNKQKVVKTPSDLSGLKIRVQDNQMNLALYEAWGGSAVAMGFSEIYTALQQGTVDGVDTSPLYQRSGKFYENATHYTMTNHQALVMCSLINKDFLASLPEDLQKVVTDASHEAYTVQEHQIVREAEEYALSVMNDAGCETYVPTDAERAEWIAESEPVYEQYKDDIDTELFAFFGR